MNRERAKLLLPIIQAFAEGKTIEFQTADGDWTRSNTPSFCFDHKRYRIKPEPQVVRIVYDKNNSAWASWYPESKQFTLSDSDLLKEYSNKKYDDYRPFRVATLVEKLD